MTTPQKSFSDLINSGDLVLVDFYAEWCGPCKMMKPVLEQLKGSIGDKARIVKVDVDKNASAAEYFKINSVPTLILFKQGKAVWRQSGVVPPGTIKSVIDANLSGQPVH